VNGRLTDVGVCGDFHLNLIALPHYLGNCEIRRDVDRSAGVDQPGSTQGAGGTAGGRRDPGRPDDVDARTAAHSLGQLPPQARRTAATDLQLHVGHQGLVRLHAPTAPDCAVRRPRQHSTATGLTRYTTLFLRPLDECEVL